jgi:hypothetical protein
MAIISSFTIEMRIGIGQNGLFKPAAMKFGSERGAGGFLK